MLSPWWGAMLCCGLVGRTWGSQCSACLAQCWETRVGQEMYKLTVFDFITVVAVMILVEFPRRLVFGIRGSALPLHYEWDLCWFMLPVLILLWRKEVRESLFFTFLWLLLASLFALLYRMLVDHCPCKLAQFVGRQEFVVPQNVLGLVYGQTVVWTGALFCPLLPAINTIKFIIIFYCRKVRLGVLNSTGYACI